MSSTQKAITVLRLKERATLDWLERAFAFELSQVTPGEGGGLQHAELRWGDDWLMASTEGQLEQTAGRASVYLTVGSDAEVNELHARAVAAGATVVMEPVDMPYGGRGSTVTDPEGNHWSLGSYRPA